MKCMTVRSWEYCRTKEIFKPFSMLCFRFYIEGETESVAIDYPMNAYRMRPPQ